MKEIEFSLLENNLAKSNKNEVVGNIPIEVAIKILFFTKRKLDWIKKNIFLFVRFAKIKKLYLI